MTAFRLSLVYKKTTFRTGYDGLDPLGGEIELFRQGFVLDTVAEPALQERPVPLVVDMLVYQESYL